MYLIKEDKIIKYVLYFNYYIMKTILKTSLVLSTIVL